MNNIPSSYLDKIRAVYNNISFDHLDFIQDGMVNDVVVVNHELVCRFVKEDWGKEILSHEAKVLEVVQRYIDLPVPRFEHLEADFVTYRYLKGEPLSRNALLKLSETVQARVISQLATYHQQLHSIPTQVLATAGVSYSGAARSREDWLQLYTEVQETLFPYLWLHQQTSIHELFAPVVSGELDLSYTPALIHGDLSVYHILFDPESQNISGILDFGVAGLGDPACDIATQLGNYGENIVRRMASDYPMLRHLIDRARFWVGTLELQWALMGVKYNDVSLSLAHIGCAREVQPVGTVLGG
ncbi:phosphotransferase [Chlorogloeopsis sp. ULAP01]|uniref:phosphotransferase family protein n=1 Tax=Chlorogloeopsis sp. ULAP01 TaxID=3056483 RepID=UPI0025AA33D7|nr:phosphotransferase [Chlorogloeopsis sp. ULAP01]MDM9382641.1 phosphotransferase [Chlorogloeopsis sp. ULAP01]